MSNLKIRRIILTDAFENSKDVVSLSGFYENPDGKFVRLDMGLCAEGMKVSTDDLKRLINSELTVTLDNDKNKVVKVTKPWRLSSSLIYQNCDY